MARPTKLTPALQEAIVRHVENGNFLETSAQAEGIDPTTLFDWIRRGDRGDKPFDEFSQAIARARANAERAMVEELRHAVTNEDHAKIKSLTWLLERTRRGKFGASIDVRNKAEESLRDGLRRICSQLSPGAYAEVIRLLAAEGSSRGVGEDSAGDGIEG